MPIGGTFATRPDVSDSPALQAVHLVFVMILVLEITPEQEGNRRTMV